MIAEPLRANLAFPTRYRLGWGRRVELAAEARGAGITRPLVVTDRGVFRLPWFAPLLEQLAADGLPAIGFADLGTNPTEAEVIAGVEAYRAAGADGVIAIGGGSAMDVGKVVALLAGHGAGRPGDVATFAVGGARSRGVDPAKVAPIVAVPTTAGTGSELSAGAVITEPAAAVKRTLVHAALMPRAVIADPELTAALPAAITAATGMDALTHCLEALCAPGYHPMCDGIALEALRLIATQLPRAVRFPDDVTARTHMLMAAGMAAVAFQKGLGLCHALAHPLGALAGVHHGLANAVLLPHVLDVNHHAIAAPCARLVATLRLGGGDPVAAVRGWVVGLNAEIGLPSTLVLDAVTRGDRAALIGRLVPLALAERVYLATNPHPITADDVASAYRGALA